jgi:hypothetical protein
MQMGTEEFTFNDFISEELMTTENRPCIINSTRSPSPMRRPRGAKADNLAENEIAVTERFGR